MSHHHHDHHAPHSAHGVGQLAATALWAPRVYRLGRRQFLADLGRRTFAVAILGSGLAACSSDDPSTAGPESTPGSTPDAAPSPTTATGDDEPSEPTTTEPPEPDVAPAALQWSQVSLGFVSAYVLVRGNEAAVVDTGNPGSSEDIGAALATMGAGWGQVRHVLLTHSHPDHVGSLGEVLAETPGATAYAGAGDIASIRSPNPLQAVSDGDNVFGLQILETPGHTPGSIAMLDVEIGLLIAGDALNGDDAGTTVSGPNPQFTPDMGTAEDTVRRLAEFEIETAVFGHGNPVLTGAGRQLQDLAATL